MRPTEHGWLSLEKIVEALGVAWPLTVEQAGREAQIPLVPYGPMGTREGGCGWEFGKA